METLESSENDEGAQSSKATVTDAEDADSKQWEDKEDKTNSEIVDDSKETNEMKESEITDDLGIGAWKPIGAQAQDWGTLEENEPEVSNSGWGKAVKNPGSGANWCATEVAPEENWQDAQIQKEHEMQWQTLWEHMQNKASLNIHNFKILKVLHLIFLLGLY